MFTNGAARHDDLALNGSLVGSSSSLFYSSGFHFPELYSGSQLTLTFVRFRKTKKIKNKTKNSYVCSPNLNVSRVSIKYTRTYSLPQNPSNVSRVEKLEYPQTIFPLNLVLKFL